jgi:hypothetical protein
MTALTNLVTLTPVDPPGPGLRFHMDGDDEPAGGIGGWEVIDRPRRRGAAEWVGVRPWALALPLYTDGHDVRPGVNHSVEQKIADLIQLAYKVPGGFQPPILEVTGPVRVPRPGMRWVIEDIRWGEQERRSDQQRIYQTMTVLLLEHVTAEVLLGPAAQARARS